MSAILRKLESHVWLWLARRDERAGRMESAVIAYGIADDLLHNCYGKDSK